MKLYAFDHCPFCVRVRMIIGLKNLPVHIKYLLQDDAELPIRLTGSRLKPFLEYAPNQYMRESLTIVQYLDALDDQPILTAPSNTKIKAWIAQYNHIYDRLITPLYHHMDLPEFATDAARQEYQRIHQSRVDDFEKLELEAPQLLQLGEAALEALAVEVDIHRVKAQKYSMDDIHLYPILRHISAVANIRFPAPIQQYLDLISQATKVPTYTQMGQSVPIAI